jgi:Polyketide cyclase / dehydrase and lipid transport
MKILKIIVVSLFALILILVLVSFLLPRNVTVVREASINASLWVVHSQVAAPTNWQQWGVWNKRDPNMLINYSGPGAGVGAKWSWQSKTEGNGDMEITRDDTPRELAYTLKFADWGMLTNGRFKFAPTNDVVTNVTWTMEADLGNNPINRYFGLFMDRMVGEDFAASLTNLKSVAEKIATTRPNDGLLAPPAAVLTKPDAAQTEPVEGAKVQMRDIPVGVGKVENKDNK